jgi:hypothetical protein
VRPSKLELYVADADGTDAHQVTYLDAASFGPAFMPGGKRIIFASNVGDPRGREFDLWAIDVAGTHLERITAAPGFDGFPLFSVDGKRLVFASNRATAPGQHDTNVFVADWKPDDPLVGNRAPNAPADRILFDVRWLADPDREGRGIGTTGLESAGAYIEERFKLLHLEPAGDNGGYRQPFPVRTGLKVEPATALRLAGAPVPSDGFQPLGFSGTGKAVGRWCSPGNGLVDKELSVDDYAGVDARGKVVIVRRFVPEHAALSDGPSASAAPATCARKAWLGARARRTGLAGRRSTGPSQGRPRPTGSRPRSRRCRRRARAVTATRGSPC